tara:strand:- start:10895 stop:11884 length:990 start_codon:yes stop_codon:yes gene_type:complete
MKNEYFVSAYATSPSSGKWTPSAETVYFQELAKKADISGIEHPFCIEPEKYPLSWMIDNIPEHWSIIITALPLFMSESQKNPFLGLASEQEKSRCQAVQIMERILCYSKKLNHAFDRKIVKALHFHSLPRNEITCHRGNKKALRKSLSEIKNMDWQGIALNLEHCDAYINNQCGDKQFLQLEDEIEVLTEINGYGLVLNWARSAIEGRSTLTPLHHIKIAKQADLLRGFFFSGCTDAPESRYGCWQDTHMPPFNPHQGPFLSNKSLLGKTEIREVLLALNDVKTPIYIGIKVSDRPPSKSVPYKRDLNLKTIGTINHVKKSIFPDSQSL